MKYTYVSMQEKNAPKTSKSGAFWGISWAAGMFDLLQRLGMQRTTPKTLQNVALRFDCIRFTDGHPEKVSVMFHFVSPRAIERENPTVSRVS
jgi:hypothetical protein